MKKLSYLLSAGVLVAMLAVIGCSKDDGGGLTPVDAAGVNFEGTWVVGTDGSVTFDSQPRTSDYTNFTLSITYNTGTGEGSYSATGGPDGSSPWPPSGTWNFQSDSPDANSFTIERTGGGEVLPITVAISGETITLDFTFDDSVHQGSRTEAVNGNWTFILTQQ